MKKLSTILGAGALALSLSGFAFAADQQQSGDPQQREQQYQAALKKCESLPATEQQKCIDAAKKKFGQM
jgi:Spy/CpxP family protein refolding chaperone